MSDVKGTSDQLSCGPGQAGADSSCAEPEITSMSASEITLSTSQSLEQEVEPEEGSEEEEKGQSVEKTDSEGKEDEWQDILGNGQLMKKVGM